MMQDDDTPAQTLALAFDFATSGFAEAWDTRAKQATTDLVVAAAIVDPRYKDKLSSMPAADVVRGEAFIEQLAGRMMGQQAQTKAKGQLRNYKSRPREIGITPAAVAATQTAGVAPETFWTDISHSCAELSEVLSRDGALRDEEDFAAYVKWLDSLNNEEEQEKQQQQQQQQQEQQ
ncbi:hypothetical protein OEZ85_000789 [Tetradesmus obliquus]|uniref:Uncharacterized protein n=1 Tax=Tetradesmus obliquus TaxID=3088 RepID=A0ABY8UPS4_TETOB|nr:hypothetical protein OEZ85_000789 [Tetradesmus obliquus]